MSFGDEHDIPDEPEIPAVNRERAITVELNDADATLLRLLAERLGLQPPSNVRVALVALASQERRWWSCWDSTSR